MKNTTTIECSKSFHKTFRKWLKSMNITSVEFFDKLETIVISKHQQKFYNSLPDPRLTNKSKPLENIRIQKNYRKACCL